MMINGSEEHADRSVIENGNCPAKPTSGVSRAKSGGVEVRIYDEQSGKLLTTYYNIPFGKTVRDVKVMFQSTYAHFVADRQRYKTKDRRVLNDETTLRSLVDTAIPSTLEVYFKDLGPQISWRTVFIAEYVGPLLIYLIFYLLPKQWVYTTDPAWDSEESITQNFSSLDDEMVIQKNSINVHILCLMWCVHFSKRIYESIFVHRFSHATMPVGNLFKNCAYYWGFAAWIAYLINHPLYTPVANRIQFGMGVLAFALGEYGNAQCHLLLRDLRRQPKADSSETMASTARRIPFPNPSCVTRMFNLVSFPNYFYEALAWIGYSLASQCLASLIFCVVGFIQMTTWAKSKHRRYLKEFPDYPRHRKAIIPFIY